MLLRTWVASRACFSCAEAGAFPIAVHLCLIVVRAAAAWGAQSRERVKRIPRYLKNSVGLKVRRGVLFMWRPASAGSTRAGSEALRQSRLSAVAYRIADAAHLLMLGKMPDHAPNRPILWSWCWREALLPDVRVTSSA